MRRWPLVRRDVVIIVLSGLALTATWSVREVPNESRGPAIALTQQMDAIYRTVISGETTLADRIESVTPDITGLHLARATDDRWILAGSTPDQCFVLWWSTDAVRRVRTLDPTSDCVPSARATTVQAGSFQEIGRTVEDPLAPSGWDPLLPDPVRYRVWFLPAMILAGGTVLAALVRISIVLMPGGAN